MLHHRSVQPLHLFLIPFLIVFNHALVKSHNAAYNRRLLPVTFGYGAPSVTVSSAFALRAWPTILHIKCAVWAWPIKIVVRRRYWRGVEGFGIVVLDRLHHLHGECSWRSLSCTTKAASNKQNTRADDEDGENVGADYGGNLRWKVGEVSESVVGEWWAFPWRRCGSLPDADVPDVSW